MNKYKNILLWLFVAIILISVFSNFGPRHTNTQAYSYSEFIKNVAAGKVSSVLIEGDSIRGTTSDNRQFTTYLPMQDQYLMSELIKKGVNVTGKPPEQRGLLAHMLISWLPFIILIGIWIFFMRQMQGGGGKGGPMSFGRSKAKLLGEDQVKVTFKDVAGCDEAKHEVVELVEFLRDPGKFQKLGGRIPRGVLLVGSPGTGKTLLAKAVAGEAKVPFFTISGSDFVEMFVGVGASRVRDMFEQAKKQSPCIIFIDEIDAVGRHRGAGLGGGHDEREQTLNQLLVEMDGFGAADGVIVMAATNRPDVLDPALLRPGRFDRQVVVPLPDIKGREEILKVHLRKVPMDKDVKAGNIARGTPGFSGADLANLVNEAALFAARSSKKLVDMHELEKAKDKIIMGSERRSMVMDEDEKKLTAYHEAGHAIVGLSVPQHDPVYKVSIIPRGRALGVTMFLPEQDRYSYSRLRLHSQMKSLFGGRLAEVIIFGEENVTTGASNDIERATELARNMVTKWGLSEKLGPLTYGEEEGEVFLGRQMSQRKEVSDETNAVIDQEIRNIVDTNYKAAEEILKGKMDILHLMADALMKYETIDEDQIADIMQGKTPNPPKNWDEDDKNDLGQSQSETTTDASDDKVDKADSANAAANEAPDKDHEQQNKGDTGVDAPSET
ncbi:MAG: ATP-dependent zinc metalloprotease FtsH [Coxiellaceae bacterium]|nr:ATP-dependent zinc metalloprotease FtsH [Coxiellaceae bacterium]